MDNTDKDRLDWLEARPDLWVSHWHTAAGWTVHIGANVVVGVGPTLREAIDTARLDAKGEGRDVGS